MKNILIFIAGVCVGVIVALYNDVLSKPVLPTVDDEPTVEWLGDERVLWEPTVDDDLYGGFDIVSTIDALRGRIHPELDDTQPVRVENEVGVWELEQWAKESE